MDSVVIASYVLKLVFLVLSGVVVLRAYLRKKRLSVLRASGHVNISDGDAPCIFGFFHPYANAAGGGERVLFMAIRAIQRSFGASAQCVVYTGDSVKSCSDEDILAKCKAQFGIELPHRVVFVRIRSRFLLEATLYPRFTLIGQAVGSMLVALEAFWRAPCDVFVDTCGHAFAYPVVHLLSPGSKITCYVHYPTVSTDMLRDVRERRAQFNNAEYVARSRLLSSAKLLYYRLFAALYGVCGRLSDAVYVNSSWTAAHILELWRIANRTAIVYPPCALERFESLFRERERRERNSEARGGKRAVISIGQFRPEKNHKLQIDAFRLFKDTVENGKSRQEYELVLLGGSRNEEDDKRIRDLKAYAQQKGLESDVRFVVNASLGTLEKEVLSAECAFHSMTNEHFGICVVECLAAGLLTVANASGGPLTDIIGTCKHETERCGWLATSAEEYAQALTTAFQMDSTERRRVRRNALETARRFSDEAFERSFVRVLYDMIRDSRANVSNANATTLARKS